MSSPFDLVDWQRTVRECYSAATLYNLWNSVCTMKDHGAITQYDFDEMRAVVFPRMKELEAAKTAVNEQKQ